MAILVLWLLVAPGGEDDDVVVRAGPPDRTDEGVLVVRAGRIITGAGPELRPGAMLISKGKIKRIAGEIAAPKNARVIDLGGATVIPGLVDAADWGLLAGPPNEETSEVTPAVRIIESLNPRSGEISRRRRMGITTVHLEPGDRNVIGGLGSVVKLRGGTIREMLLREDVCLKGVVGPGPSAGNWPPRGSQPSFYSRRPTTQMGVEWVFRKAFLDARASRGAPTDPSAAILVKVLERKIPVRVAASTRYDIETTLRLGDEFGLLLQLEEAEEAYIYAAVLAKRKIPVALRPHYATGAGSGKRGMDPRFSTFARLSRAGVKVSLLAGGREPNESLLAMAAFSVRYGAARDEALKAVTLYPAEMLGVADRVGSLEEGKDADFVVLSGDPFDLKTRVQSVWIDGYKMF